MVVNEIGLEPLMSLIVERILSPLSKLLYPDELIVTEIDHHHSFVVEYSATAGKDTYLDMHHDASEVTMNICVGREFEGSHLKFCGRFGSCE
jgi:hypothetical protein